MESHRRNRLREFHLAVPLLRPEELAGIPIPFKENLVLLFDAVLEGTDGPDRILYLRQICQHTELVAAPEEADLILTMEKSAEGKGVSLVDRNFYLDK